MTQKPCIICVAITGSLPTKADNPAVPVTVSEQIESTHEAFEAGATICHAHVRNDDETPSSDPDKFAASFAADPVAAAKAFTGPGGFADRVKGVADTSSDRFTGSITAAINSRTSTISRLNASIADWDDRLALRRSNLERQYTALETTLSQLQGQQSWLTSQLSSLKSSTQ